MGTGWWVAETLHSAGAFALAAWAFWVIFSITLHELGHGFAAIRVGDDTPIRLGRMTMNPLVHMGPTSLIVFAVVGIAWGMMPVNPHKFRGRHADAFVAAAGPAVNVGLFVLCVIVYSVVAEYAFTRPAMAAFEQEIAASTAKLAELGEDATPEQTLEIIGDMPGFTAALERKDAPFLVNTKQFFYSGAMLNAALLVLNLLPIPPLDGSRILASFSRTYERFAESPQASMAALVLILFVFLAGGEYLWIGASTVTGIASQLISGVLP